VKKSLIWMSVLVLTLTLVLSFSLAGCKKEAAPAEEEAVEEAAPAEAPAEEEAVEEAAPAEKFKIGVLCALFDDKWMSYMHQGMEEKAAEVADIAEVTLVDGNNEPELQLSQAEDFIAQGVDAIVLVPINTMEENPILDVCLDAGVPLVTVNRKLVRQELADCYVGSDSLVAGELQMGYLAEVAGGKGKVAIMQGELFHEAAINRTQGFKNILEGYPDMEVVVEDTANWKRDEGQTLVENWLQSGIDFNIIASNNDEMAIGAILALQGQGIDPTPYYIGGVDCTPDALEYLKQGFLDCTVFQDAYGQGHGGIEAAIKILQGEDVPDIMWIPYELVTPDDYEEYLAKWQ